MIIDILRLVRLELLYTNNGVIFNQALEIYGFSEETISKFGMLLVTLQIYSQVIICRRDILIFMSIEVYSAFNNICQFKNSLNLSKQCKIF